MQDPANRQAGYHLSRGVHWQREGGRGVQVLSGMHMSSRVIITRLRHWRTHNRCCLKQASLLSAKAIHKCWRHVGLSMRPACVCDDVLQGAEASQPGDSNCCRQPCVYPECCSQEQQDLAEDQGAAEGHPGVFLCATQQHCVRLLLLTLLQYE